MTENISCPSLLERQTDPLLVLPPVDIEGPAVDVRERQRSPVSGVQAVVAVVSKHETMTRGDLERTEVVSPGVRRSPAVEMDLIGLDDRAIVDIDLSIPDLELIAREADHPLD